MKNLTTPLGLFGLGYLLLGTVMNILMYAERMWPTYIYFIAMGIGILFLLSNKLTKRLPNYRLWQTAIGVLPLILLLIQMEVWNITHQTITADKNQNLVESSCQNGDIIFQTSRSNQSQAIQLATSSKYSHMGIIYEDEGEYYVYEAVQPVKLTPLAEWINRGENGHYVIKRLENADQILTSSTLTQMKKFGEQFKGKPYDIYFEWSDDKIYCSELVWKIYKEGADIEIGQLEQLSDFDLTNDIVKAKMKERYGENIPMDEKVISPASMFNSDKLITVKSN
jgi:uncharacterized protein YycO